MSNRIHSHDFRGVTTLNNGHTHGYAGSTSQDPDIPGHVHMMSGTTAFADGHIHQYSLYTGPEMETDGGHTHYYQAETTYNDGHVHYIYGYTSVY